MESNEYIIQINKTDVHYWAYGNKANPCLVFVHGFRGTHHGFEKIIENLSAYYCLVPDLPGFGKSRAFNSGPHSLTRYVDFLSQFTNQIGAAPHVIVGHSFGSIIASHFAAAYPEHVEKLVLINPISAPALKGPKKIATWLALAYYWTAQKLPVPMAHKLLSSRVIVDAMSQQMAVSKNKELRKYIFDQHQKHFSTFASPRIVAESFDTSVRHTTFEVVERLTMPTLVVAARKDQISSVASQIEFSNQLSKGNLCILEDVGHLVHYEKATEAAVAIDAFLRK